MSNTFWTGKKVLVTGHTGFKGSWLSLMLQNRGAFLIGYSLMPDKKNNLFDLALVADGMKSVIGDIRDSEKLNKTMSDFAPEIVIHMAAQPLVRFSYENPLETYSTNVMGTINTLEAIRKTNSVRVFLNVTTDKCYENKEDVLNYSEEDPIGGNDPYSNSKACSELVTKAYRSSFFNKPGSVKIASARAGNVIGGGDWAKDRLIPDIIKSINKKKPVIVRNPNAVRPWQHVLEPLSGYLLLLERLYLIGDKYAEGWNFGPKEEDDQKVKRIVEYFIKRWGYKENYIEDNSDQPKEAQILRLDITKANNKLGWEPKWNLYKALDTTIEWYKSFMNNENIRNLTFKQINEYENYEVN